VALTQGFYVSKYEVTEQWWHQVMGGTPTDPQLPKSHVSWDMAVQFCNALSIQEGLTSAYVVHDSNGDVTWDQNANGYRLPTEAEWAYACRATTTMAYHNDSNCLSSDSEANFIGNTTQLSGCSLGVYRGARTDVRLSGYARRLLPGLRVPRQPFPSREVGLLMARSGITPDTRTYRLTMSRTPLVLTFQTIRCVRIHRPGESWQCCWRRSGARFGSTLI
jgi:hypothetical protein